jgi:hypothetical protein
MKWDLTSKNSLDACAEWVRSGSDALLVLVVRPNDFSFAVHKEIAPHDAADMVESMLQDLALQLASERNAAREAAKAKAEKKAAKTKGVS